MQESQPKMESLLAIDEFSVRFGKMEATVETLLRHTHVQNAMLNKIDDKLTITNGSVGKAHSRMDVADPILKKAAEQGNDWEDTKGRLKWLAGLSIFGASAGGFSFTKWFGNLFS
jgi:hypothetical protein